MDNFPIDHSALPPFVVLNGEFHGSRSNCVCHPSSEPWTRISLQGLHLASAFGSAESHKPWPTRGTMFWSERNGSFVFHPDRDVAVLARPILASATNFQELEVVQRILEPARGKCETPGRIDTGNPSKDFITRKQEVDLPKRPPLKNLKQNQNEEQEEIGGVVDSLTDFDVLCGRGEHVNRHPGNKIFHAEKVKLQPRYLRAIKRKEKTAIAQELVDLMKSRYGSRFLGYSSEKKQYHVIDHRRVLEKAKQVLRETFTPEQRKIKRERYFRPKKKMFYAQCLADLRNAKA